MTLKSTKKNKTLHRKDNKKLIKKSQKRTKNKADQKNISQDITSKRQNIKRQNIDKTKNNERHNM